MKEFQINQYLSVQLKAGESMIYVAKQPFRQCKLLLLNIPITDVSSFDELESIDEIAEKIDERMEREIVKTEIPPETEFWGHCSNLQVWYEHDYDTRLIHSNLAFPLLKKLTEVGDLLAKKVFKSEIISRYEKGDDRTRDYLEAEGFLNNFTLDERMALLIDNVNLVALTELAEELRSDKDPYTFIFDFLLDKRAKVENRKIIDLSLRNLKLSEFPKAILGLTDLRVLSLRRNNIKEIPEKIHKLSSLKELWLISNEISHLPESICKITTLEALWIDVNKILSLPENIGDLVNLKILRTGSNQLKKLPKSFSKLKSLENLSISNNKLKEFPKCIKCMSLLEYLDVRGNPFVNNPKSVEKLKKLNIKKIVFK
ncbi:MAG: leucine-rich repeat domain-containing protein [Promethearchaeota archaeon]|jgi:hypothetical protein